MQRNSQLEVGAGRLSTEAVNGFVTFVYDGKWWLGYVLSADELEQEVTVMFIHPAGPYFFIVRLASFKGSIYLLMLLFAVNKLFKWNT